MKIQHLKTDLAKSISWASGTSTELFIFPANTDFKLGDFTFRVSIATVEVEETVFTALPSVVRTLMVLQGKLSLSHKSHHTKELRAFDQDTFQGEWETQSKGLATNFNLICSGNSAGELTHTFAWLNTKVQFELTADFELFYLQSGNAEVNGEKLKTGDLLVVERESENQLVLSCLQSCNIVQCSVLLDAL
jgi:environmental stress-induced protein Ves